jgi:hypothetical protein
MWIWSNLAMGASDGKFEVKINLAAPDVERFRTKIHFHKKHLVFCLNAAIGNYWNGLYWRELECSPKDIRGIYRRDVQVIQRKLVCGKAIAEKRRVWSPLGQCGRRMDFQCTRPSECVN